MMGRFLTLVLFNQMNAFLVRIEDKVIKVDLAYSIVFTAKNFCPPIYPLGDHQWQTNVGIPLICLHSLQLKPSPVPPCFASQTVIACQPLMVCIDNLSC